MLVAVFPHCQHVSEICEVGGVCRGCPFSPLGLVFQVRGGGDGDDGVHGHDDMCWRVENRMNKGRRQLHTYIDPEMYWRWRIKWKGHPRCILSDRQRGSGDNRCVSACLGSSLTLLTCQDDDGGALSCLW
jgi:hypothetical protein